MPKIKSIAELKRDIAATEKQLAKLATQRKTTARQLANVDREIAALSGEAIAPTRKGKKKAAPPV